MLARQVLPAILSTPFVIQIVCGISLETDICIPKTLVNKQNCDIKVLMKSGVKSWKPPELESDLKAVLQPNRERARSKQCSLSQSPAGMIPGPLN